MNCTRRSYLPHGECHWQPVCLHARPPSMKPFGPLPPIPNLQTLWWTTLLWECLASTSNKWTRISLIHSDFLNAPVWQWCVLFFPPHRQLILCGNVSRAKEKRELHPNVQSNKSSLKLAEKRLSYFWYSSVTVECTQTGTEQSQCL